MPILGRYADDHIDFEICNMPFAEFRNDIFRLLKTLEQGSERIDRIMSEQKIFLN